MENGFGNMNVNIIEQELIQRRTKINKKLIVGLVAALITITIAIFLFGYLIFGWFQKPQDYLVFEWFQKSQDNVIQNTYHNDQVMLFKEVKTMKNKIKQKIKKNL